MTQSKRIRVLFVCLGNICRSPMAEAVFRHLVKEAGLDSQIEVESAGTGGWHVGDPPHRGTLEVLRRNLIDASGMRARKLTRSDREAYDYVIAMDAENVRDIEAVFGKPVPRLLDFAPPGGPLDVPDPYYTGGFDHVYSLVQAGSRGLIEYIRKQEGI